MSHRANHKHDAPPLILYRYPPETHAVVVEADQLCRFGDTFKDAIALHPLRRGKCWSNLRTRRLSSSYLA